MRAVLVVRCVECALEGVSEVSAGRKPEAGRSERARAR
jgi:hypothetical protein